MARVLFAAALAVWIGILSASASAESSVPRIFPPGQQVLRNGDEIMVCGQLFHTGAPVVLWLDPNGYDAYRPERHFPSTNPSARDTVSPSFGTRMSPLTDEEVARVRNGNWTLPFLQEKVDQFVIHYDVCGLSSICFKVLHDQRGLSVHFMLDIDGTIYQTMDLKDQASHTMSANGRSIGVEIANVGAYSINSSVLTLQEWYAKDSSGQVRITIPARVTEPNLRLPHFVGHPIRNEMVMGMVHGKTYRQYDFTQQQYESLSHLTAALCTIFPKITCDYPRQRTALGPPTTAPANEHTPPGDPTTMPSALASPLETGVLIPHQLTWQQFDNYQGVLGHYHLQSEKQDPGPAFQWDRMIEKARALMTPAAKSANLKARGHPAKFIPSSTSKPATTAGE